MGISPRLLGDGEYVVRSTRTHVKALLWPIVLFILISGVTFLLVPWVPSNPPLLIWLIAVVASAAIAYWVVRPIAVWVSATYTLTNRRLITRRGVFTRLGHDIPLYRVHDVSYEHGLVDRILGCGTLVISAASERGRVVLPDVPNVEDLQLAMTELLMDDADHGYDARYDHGYDNGHDHGYDARYDQDGGYSRGEEPPHETRPRRAW
jgi:uncharacterized membrane protein YdbT with pleckstrin-like domain